MKKRTLNYRFHNPNTAEATAEYIANLLVEANRSKVESLLAEVMAPQQPDTKTDAAK